MPELRVHRAPLQLATNRGLNLSVPMAGLQRRRLSRGRASGINSHAQLQSVLSTLDPGRSSSSTSHGRNKVGLAPGQVDFATNALTDTSGTRHLLLGAARAQPPDRRVRMSAVKRL